MKRITLTIVTICIACVGVADAESNEALEAWKAYATKSGNSDHAKWVEEISKPEAIALAKAWKELRGYDEHDLIAAALLVPIPPR